jgi:PTH2 family peptidyl-tRNA hydrolase
MNLRYKQCVVVRGDLKLSTGKWCAQVAHAAVSSAERARYERPLWYRAWLLEGQRKIVLLASGEEELMALYKRATELKLPTSMVVDMGLTEIPPETLTCIGIGPAPEEMMDRITGDLPLF